MIWKLIIATVATFGTVWFGRLTYIASQGSGTGYLGEFCSYGILAIICVLIAVGFGVWAGWTWLLWLLN